MKWEYTIDIKKFLDLYDEEETPLPEIGAKIRKAFQDSYFGKSPDSFESLFWLLDRLCDNHNDVGDFDMYLSDLYDWADDTKVWLGL